MDGEYAGEREVLSVTSPTLLASVKAEDRAGWTRLVSLYGPLVYRWCRCAGLQPADAADLGQEVFCAVARNISNFRRDRPGDSFRAWLHTITLNKIRDHTASKQAANRAREEKMPRNACSRYQRNRQTAMRALPR